MPTARKSDSMPNVRASSGTIGTTSSPTVLSRRSFASIRTEERRVGHAFVRDGNPEAVPEEPQVRLVHLLLLVGDVLAFTGLAEAVALDGPGQDDGRRPLVAHRRAVRVVHLVRIVAADAKALELVVRQGTHHVEQPGVGAPEVLAE